MIATALAAAALAAPAPQVHPCRTPLPHGPVVPAPIVLWTSCGSFRLAPDGQVSLLPRHWLAKHGGGTGRRYGAQLNIRRTRPGRILLLLHRRVVWRSADLYPSDGGNVAFGPHSFAFASYNRGVYLSDLDGPERLVARGRGLYPYSFTSRGDLIVAGIRSIRLVSPNGITLRRFTYRPRNRYGFDEQTDTLYYVTPGGRLAAAQETQIALERSVRHIDGMLALAQPNLLVFSGSRSITVTRRDGALIAEAHWSSRHLNLDGGVAASPNGKAFAFRLSDARPGARSSTATVYLLSAGATRAQPLYRHRLGPSGCAVGAGFSWHGSSLLYSSSDGTLAVLNSHSHATTRLTALARTLPHRSPGERANATWRSDFHG
jgi:hypothetical protein